MTSLELRKRSDDWHCQLKGEGGIWQPGRTPAEAIGNWIMAHKWRGLVPCIEWEEVKFE